MWYLLNEYYLCLHFELEFYRYIFPRGNRYFHKLWFELLKNDAHEGEWIDYPKVEHPRFGCKITSTWNKSHVEWLINCVCWLTFLLNVYVG